VYCRTSIDFTGIIYYTKSDKRVIFIYLLLIEFHLNNDMISKILVAVDGSKNADKAFEYACDLAKKAGASLLILHVSEELGTVGYSINKQLERDYREMLQKYESRAKKVMKTYVDVMETKANDVAEEVLRTADKENIDTIVVGSRGISKAKTFLLGSVSYKVSHYARRPVVIVR
jgi:nucleotide-binding universal stress UspA family protein